MVLLNGGTVFYSSSVFLVLIVNCISHTLLDYIGRRLHTDDARILTYKENINLRSLFRNHHSPAMKLIEQSGYPAESHEIQTEDGYLLTVHRIPYGRTSLGLDVNKSKPSVLLYHGIMASSDSWLLRGPEEDLAYLLADNGYDVWIGNVRGNVYSRKHVLLDPNRDQQFWEFSFHEIGYYDVPAVIDYVLNKTEAKSLSYIGHSMGCTLFFVMCSTRPEYNNKITLMHGLSPAVYIIHRPSPLFKLFISNWPAFMRTCEEQNIYELFPLRKFTGRLGRALCHSTAPTQPLCLAGVFMVAGVDYQLFNYTLLPKLFEHYPAGTSLNGIVHFYQNIVSGSFRYFDFGEQENIKRYKQRKPPEYNLKKVTAPVSLYYGDGDYIIKRQDIEKLAGKLSNLIGVFRVPFPFFNHLDFLWGSDAKTLLYGQILLVTNKYQ